MKSKSVSRTALISGGRGYTYARWMAARRRVAMIRLFICAGAVQSVELLMRSLGIEAEATISDNMILSFPVFFSGRLPSQAKIRNYFALTNGMMIIRPHDSNEPIVFVQFYPNPDYFWQYNLPVWLWPLVAPLAQLGRNRLFWARAYLPSTQSQRYHLSLEGAGAVLSLDSKPDLAPFSTNVWAELRRVLSNSGFWVPPLPPVPAKTSSHYAGGFPMGGHSVNSDGEIATAPISVIRPTFQTVQRPPIRSPPWRMRAVLPALLCHDVPLEAIF